MRIELIGLALLLLFVGGVLYAAARLTVSSLVRQRRTARINRYRELLHRPEEPDLAETISKLKGRGVFDFMQAYMETLDHVRMSESDQTGIDTALLEAGVDVALIRRLNSSRPIRRMQAAVFLGYVPSIAGASALDRGLAHERLWSVKLRMVHAIVLRRYLQCVPTVFDSLQNAPAEYSRRVAATLRHLEYDLVQFLPVMRERRDPEVQKVFIALAARVPTEELQSYLEGLIVDGDPSIARDAFRVLVNHYHDVIEPARYFFKEDPFFRRLALEALGRRPSQETIDMIVSHLSADDTRSSAEAALEQIVHAVPRLTDYLIHVLRTTNAPQVRDSVANALAARSGYLVQTALQEQWPDAGVLIGWILRSRKAAGVLSMLNRNTNAQLEQRICGLIGDTVRSDSWLRNEFALYARDSVLCTLGMERLEIDSERGERRGESPRAGVLMVMIACLVVGPIVLFSLIWTLRRGTLDLHLIGGYLVAFQVVFAGYAFALNSIYLALLLAAVGAVIRQQKLADLRTRTMLFRRGILPSISIIAPAYNEQETIVDSVTALLNLNYPEYEVIVVNDGSPDETLSRLISHFELERCGLVLGEKLATRTVRGVYRNPCKPGLLVVDKSNGGKADSLNVGINASGKEYFAAIDADSLLEPDALLELAAGIIDSETAVVAAGGNILPVNGCLVEMGSVRRVGLPARPLARFQMMEYIRAFMTGRTGWAAAGCLLIISGAFGVFRTREVVAAGGYLTGSERYSKDTVAEDMELVVRIRRNLLDAGIPGTVQYAAAANCWTEVPDSFGILTAQRDRWQRGLIDILLFHAGMLLRPRYGRTGAVALPYYYLFEFFGPWIELQGYLFLGIGLALGVLPAGLVVAVLVASIPLGMLVSFVSLLMVERRRRLFSPWDRLGMLWMAFAENFGYRQFTNLLRIRGFLSVFGRRTGWGVMRRRGFSRTA